MVLAAVEALGALATEPGASSTDPSVLQAVLQGLASLGRPLFALFAHPAGRVADGAAVLMRAVAQVGASGAAPMRDAALKEGALLQHLHQALFAVGPKAALSQELVACWADEYQPALALLRRTLPPGLVRYLNAPKAQQQAGAASGTSASTAASSRGSAPTADAGAVAQPGVVPAGAQSAATAVPFPLPGAAPASTGLPASHAGQPAAIQAPPQQLLTPRLEGAAAPVAATMAAPLMPAGGAGPGSDPLAVAAVRSDPLRSLVPQVGAAPMAAAAPVATGGAAVANGAALPHAPQPQQPQQPQQQTLAAAGYQQQTLLQQQPQGTPAGAPAPLSSSAVPPAAASVAAMLSQVSGGLRGNWPAFWAAVARDHCHAGLIWNETTRHELRDALEGELAGLRARRQRVAQVGAPAGVLRPHWPMPRWQVTCAWLRPFPSPSGYLQYQHAPLLPLLRTHQQGAGTWPSWNHAEFTVVYPSLARHMAIGGVYVRLLLEGADESALLMERLLMGGFLGRGWRRALQTWRVDARGGCMAAATVNLLLSRCPSPRTPTSHAPAAAINKLAAPKDFFNAAYYCMLAAAAAAGGAPGLATALAKGGRGGSLATDADPEATQELCVRAMAAVYSAHAGEGCDVGGGEDMLPVTRPATCCQGF